MVLNETQFTVIKFRIPNSGQNTSKRDGFRLIYLVHKQKEEVVFLYVYPKRGAQGLNTVDAEKIVSLLRDYVSERQESKLESYASV